jgi:hypothetical protein
MHKSATKCNETIGKWCKNKHGASKIIDTFETYQPQQVFFVSTSYLYTSALVRINAFQKILNHMFVVTDLTVTFKTTHNGSIIASIMHYMHAKS